MLPQVSVVLDYIKLKFKELYQPGLRNCVDEYFVKAK